MFEHPDRQTDEVSYGPSDKPRWTEIWTGVATQSWAGCSWHTGPATTPQPILASLTLTVSDRFGSVSTVHVHSSHREYLPLARQHWDICSDNGHPVVDLHITTESKCFIRQRLLIMGMCLTIDLDTVDYNNNVGSDLWYLIPTPPLHSTHPPKHQNLYNSCSCHQV